MKRRSFGKLMVMTGTSLMVKNAWPVSLKKQAAISLPEPRRQNSSVEICLNSRVSSHGGYSGELDKQILANAVWAASKPPLFGSSRTIYATFPEAVYRYDPDNHELISHVDGNKLSEVNAAFEIGVSTNPENMAEDAGASLHWAQLASVAFWGKGQTPVCCPKDSAYENANEKWNPVTSVHLVNCYGRMGSVSGLKTTMVAVSSDNSLPAPVMNGSMILEDAMAHPLFGKDFSNENLTSEELSQIAWAAYGCTPHSIGSKAGLTVASWNAGYYITGRVYIVKSDSVLRYHTRKTSAETRDHRVEKMVNEDRRTQLRNAVPRISQSAPVYFVFCAEETSRIQLLEAGYCGSSALLQTTALGLQGYYCGGFTADERSAIGNAIGITSTDIPLVIFAAGKPKGTSVKTSLNRHSFNVVASPNPFVDHIRISIASKEDQQFKAAVYDISGRLIRKLVEPSLTQNGFVVDWNGCDEMGKAVASGTYICKAVSSWDEKSVLLHKK